MGAPGSRVNVVHLGRAQFFIQVTASAGVSYPTTLATADQGRQAGSAAEGAYFSSGYLDGVPALVSAHLLRATDYQKSYQSTSGGSWKTDDKVLMCNRRAGRRPECEF